MNGYLLDNAYAALFDHKCNHYSHYLNAATNNLSLNPFLENDTGPVYVSCYTRIEEDMFAPKV